MNSLKSACSFAKCTPLSLGQLKKHVEPLLGRELRVEPIVGILSRLEACENANGSVQAPYSITRNPTRQHGRVLLIARAHFLRYAAAYKFTHTLFVCVYFSSASRP
jgi:hypothetical protein